MDRDTAGGGSDEKLARRRDSFLPSAGSWVFSTSSKCWEIFIIGLSRVIGSWKIIPSSGPRSLRSSPALRSRMLRPL